MQEQQRWLRSAGAMAGITLLSRVTGYLRDLLQGYVLGAGPGSDAFVIAYRIPNLFRRLVGEGEMTAAFVPVFTRYLQGRSREEVWRFCGAALYSLSLVLVLIVLAGVTFAPLLVGLLASGFGADPGKWELTVALNRVMFPYLLCISLSALSMAILNSLGSFAYPAFSPILLNLSIGAAALLLAPRLREPAFGFAFGVLAGGVLQFLYQVPVLARRGMDFTPRFDPGHPGVRMVARLMLPGLFGAGVTQLNLVIDSQFASWLQAGSVSFLYYAVRVTELALGVFAVPVSTAVLPRLSAQAARGDTEAVRQTLSQAVRLLGFITLPATVGLVLLRYEIVAVLFQRGRFGAADTILTADALLYYSLGLMCYAGVKVFAPSFYAYQDTVTPVQVGTIVFLFHLALNFLLVRPLRHGGLALSTSLSAALNLALLAWLFVRRRGPLPGKTIGSSLGRAGTAAAVMAAGIHGLERFWPVLDAASLTLRGGRLAILVGTGIATYLGVAILLRSREPGEILRALRGSEAGGEQP